MEGVNQLLSSKIVIVLVGGLLMLVVAVIIRRGRLEGEHPSVVENVLLFGGILVTLTGILIATCSSDVLDLPKKDEKALPTYSKDAAGCSAPKNQMKDFKR